MGTVVPPARHRRRVVLLAALLLAGLARTPDADAQSPPACPFDAGAAALDADGDAVRDACDNCTTRPNAAQYDADGDGYGNACDGDLNNTGGFVNIADLAVLRAVFGTANGPADLNSSGGLVNAADLAAFRTLFTTSPGPTAFVPRLGNSTPVADAGPDQTALFSQTVTLDGTGSTDLDGHRLLHSWRVVSRPAASAAALDDPRSVRPTLLVDAAGTYVMELRVFDGTAVSAPDTVIVSTVNSAPVADAGPDRAAVQGVPVTLDGSGSSDVDGNLLAFSWQLAQRPAGSIATLSGGTTPRPSFTPDLAGTYRADLTVNDGAGPSAPDSVLVGTGNVAPLAQAGADQSVPAGAPVTLEGSGTVDPDGNPLVLEWTLPVAPAGSAAALDDPALSGPTFTADLPGTYVGQLVADDGTQASAPDTVVITTENSRPVARLGADVVTSEDVAVDVDGSGSSDADYDPLDFRWALVHRPAGSTAALAAAGDGASLVPDLPGYYLVQLVVGDGLLDSRPETLLVQALAGSGDTDGDGLTNAQETALGTSPTDADSDDDTLTDGAEVNQHGTSPLSADTDNDAFADNVELDAGTDPKNDTSTPAGTLPPNPANVAPPIEDAQTSTVADATAFLYTGTNPVQTGVAPGTIDPKRAAVLRGRVTGPNGAPLPGVAVTVKDHPELGQTLSRGDGRYDMAVNGGGPLVVDYRKSGYLHAQRQLDTPWQDFAIAEDVALVPLDAQVTGVNLASPVAMQVARGSLTTDTDGARQATVMFPAGTTAQMVLPGGGMQPLTSLSVRATEYTVGANGPERMPAGLPPTSAYTYAVELTVDEAQAAGATDVVFSQPLPFYIDNFLDFPVGMSVPTGYYDRAQARWIPSANGRVIRILGSTGGQADIDITGDNVADSSAALAALGITTAERQNLATLYGAGKSLWRVPIAHFTPWDCNWNGGPGPGAGPPDQPDPPPPNQCPGGPPQDGSIVRCENQTLGERIRVTGTPFSLNYDSGRTRGYKAGRALDLQLTGATLPPDLAATEVEITVAGQKIVQHFEDPGTNQRYLFTWDGKDAYGRTLQGAQPVSVRRGFTYPAVYYQPDQFEQAFARFSGIPITGSVARDEVTLWQDWKGTIGGWTAEGFALGGWSLDVHHAYDTQGRRLYRGDGTESGESADGASVIRTVAGGLQSGPPGDGGQATAARLTRPAGLAVAPDGSYYIADTLAVRVRRVGADGIITTVAGTGTACPAGSGPGTCGDGGPATAAQLNNPNDVALGPDGSLYIAERSGQRIRRVSPTGIISTFAGTGVFGFSGDNGPATSAQLSEPYGVAVTPDGTVYIADTGNVRIRRVGLDGIISTVAGGGTLPPGQNGDGGRALAAILNTPRDVAVGPDGSLYIAQSNDYRIRRVTPEGIIRTVAGSGVVCNPGTAACGDGGPATQAQMGQVYQVAVGPDGTMVIADQSGQRVRQVGPDGIITTLAGTGVFAFSGDGGPAPRAQVSDPAGAAFLPDGRILISDQWNARVRAVGPALPGTGTGDLVIADTDGERVFVFSASGRHLSTRHALTGATLLTFGYESAFRLVTITDGDGKVTTIERDGAGAPTAIVAPFGQRTELETNAAGEIAAIENPLGGRHQFTYATGGLLTAMTTPRNFTTTYAYDPNGRLVRSDDPAGGYQVIARTELSATNYRATHSRQATVGTAYVNQYEVDWLASGTREHTATAPDGTETVSRGFPDGRLERLEPDGALTTITAAGDPRFSMQAPVASQVVIADGGRTLTKTATRAATLGSQLDPFSLQTLTETTTVNGRTHNVAYNAATRTWTGTSPASRTDSRVLDLQGRTVQRQLPGLLAANATYDAQGRLTAVAQGSGGAQRTLGFAYDAAGEIGSYTDPLGQVTSYAYDAATRLTQLTLPGNRVATIAYDANGNVASVTPPGRTAHQYGYDALDQETSYTPPVVAGGGATTRAWDLARNATLLTQPGGRTIAMAYDGSGRLTSITVAEGVFGATYEPATGQLASLAAPGGQGLAFSYAGSVMNGVAASGAVPGTVSYTHDNDARVATQSVNGANTISVTYDADGLITGAGALALTRAAATGLVTATALGTVTDSRTYDGFGERTAYAATAGATALYSATDTRDKLGRLTQRVETIGGTTTTIVWTYDVAGRLSTVTRNGAASESYTWDANGNRLSGTVAGATSNGSYDAQDRLTQYGSATFTYHANGELLTRTAGGQTTSYQHDALGNLRGATLANGTPIVYVIDGLMRRVGKRVNGTLTQGFLYDGELQVVAELDGTGALVSRFVYVGGANVPAYMVRGGSTYRIISDQVGSPRLVVDAATGAIAQRLDYDSFGNVLLDTSPGFQPFGFAGGLYDRDTGLLRFGARDYDPRVGRWLAKDPLGFASGSFNLYAYIDGDPVNRTDPAGLQESGGDEGAAPAAPAETRWQRFKKWSSDQWDKGLNAYRRKVDQCGFCFKGGANGTSGADCIRCFCSAIPSGRDPTRASDAASAGADAAENLGNYDQNRRDRIFNAGNSD